MKVAIIEDERITALDLQITLLQIDPKLEIIAIISSVKQGIEYFENNPKPDLIFSDIRLGDGLSFDILKHIEAPVIFCTAYDEYAIEAFRVNGIGYILKPFTEDSVRGALEKYQRFLNLDNEILANQYTALTKLFGSQYRLSSLLVNHRDMVLPIRVVDIAIFYLKNNLVTLETFDQKTYFPNKSLDELEQILGDNFFRVNRQYLLSRKSIKHASNLLSRKMSVAINIPHDDIITISREKSPQFLKWLQDID